MTDVGKSARGFLQPVMTPRIEQMREQISNQELELRLVKLGLPLEISLKDN